MLNGEANMTVGKKNFHPVVSYDPAVRWKARAWALVAYLVVLAAVAAVVLFAVRYQPLSAANLASDAVPQPGRDMIVPEYAAGHSFSFGFLLANDGPLPVKILSVKVTGPNELLIPVRIETASKRDAGSLSEADPELDKFIPFTLAAGDRRWIVLRTRFGNCARFQPGAFVAYTRFQVTYTMLGFTKHAWVRLPRGIRVESPPAAACPARSA
jgi:hypothetical protein